MNLSDLPAWLVKFFAQDAAGGFVRSIPTTTGDADAASLSLGFPPNTFTDQGAGGSPPDGRDFNGILRLLSQWARWQGAGGTIPWNATIASNGGYPDAAIVQSTVTPHLFWQSTVDANTSNPDAGGANWVACVTRRASAADVQAGTSDVLVVTAKLLKDAGYDRITSSLLLVNGWRVWQSGFKECWGRVSVPANSTVVVTVPVTHVNFIVPTIGAQIDLTAGASQKVGVLPPTINTFGLVNNDAADMIVEWATRGV